MGPFLASAVAGEAESCLVALKASYNSSWAQLALRISHLSFACSRQGATSVGSRSAELG